jgi:hypothetical protein
MALGGTYGQGCRCLPCGTTGFSNESGMARCHPCPAKRHIPSSMLNSTSADDCQCPGLVFGCRFRISEVHRNHVPTTCLAQRP